MPKVIGNLESVILHKGEIELEEKGYNDFNIRDISKKCDIAIGTVYNYFPSKASLISRIVLDEWDHYLNEMEEDAKQNNNLYDSLSMIFTDLVNFVLKYEDIFASKMVFENSNSNDSRSICLDIQILISKLLKENGYTITEFEESFIAEAFFFYAVKRDFSYNKLDSVIHKILEK